MSRVASGDPVAIHYTGRLEDGTVFDTNDGGEPLAFTAGGSELISGMSEAVVGMAVGDKKTVTLPPEQAYGERDEALRFTVERDQLPEEAAVGDHVGGEIDGHVVPLEVVELRENEAVLDANHVLSGKTLIFDLEVIAFGDDVELVPDEDEEGDADMGEDEDADEADAT